MEFFKEAYLYIGDAELALFREYLCKNSGIVIPPEKAYLFETRLPKMMIDAGVETFSALYDYVVSGTDPLATQKMINAMATNETLWYRDGAPWKIMSDILLPKLIGAMRRGEKSKIRIWCAAVSTGQEAYSTVMCVDDYLAKNKIVDIKLSNFEFLATDISTRVLDIAQKGRYDAISIMRGLDDHLRNKYFEKDGTAWNLDPKIRDAVRFERFNLQNSCLKYGSFDIIFLRYVLIYFSNELKKEVISKMHGTLYDGGTIFTENYVIQNLLNDYFDINHHGNSTYFTKKAVKK